MLLLQPQSLQSYVRFMHEHLFDHVDIPAEAVHIPDGTLALQDVAQYCLDYEKKIRDAGGLDVQVGDAAGAGGSGVAGVAAGANDTTAVAAGSTKQTMGQGSACLVAWFLCEYCSCCLQSIATLHRTCMLLGGPAYWFAHVLCPALTSHGFSSRLKCNGWLVIVSS